MIYLENLWTKHFSHHRKKNSKRMTVHRTDYEQPISQERGIHHLCHQPHLHKLLTTAEWTELLSIFLNNWLVFLILATSSILSQTLLSQTSFDSRDPVSKFFHDKSSSNKENKILLTPYSFSYHFISSSHIKSHSETDHTRRNVRNITCK